MRRWHIAQAHGALLETGPDRHLSPTLLGDFPAPTLRVYPVYTVIAEKYQAMVILGHANSRMKDFFDLAVIARRTDLDGATLATAIAATFARRQTHLPTERPLALTKQFSEDAAKLRQWQAFLNKNHIESGSLSDTVPLLDDLLWPPTEIAAVAVKQRPHGAPKPCAGPERGPAAVPHQATLTNPSLSGAASDEAANRRCGRFALTQEKS